MKTVVGLVASCRDAEELVRELTAGGFKIEDLVGVGEEPVKGLLDPGCGVELFHSVESVEEFFGTEEDPEVKDHYAEGVRRGGVLVSVFAEDEDCDRAAGIMIERCVADIKALIETLKQGDSLSQDADSDPGSTRKGFSVAGVRGRVRIYDHSSVAVTSTWEPFCDRFPNNRL